MRPNSTRDADASKYQPFIEKAIQFGAKDAKIIHPSDIVVAEWVRMKCQFGCDDYGKNLACPPYTPDLEFVKRMLGFYSTALIIHFQMRMPEDEERRAWTFKMTQEIVNLEREAFLSGYYRSWGMGISYCRYCESCLLDKYKCPRPELARPTPESMGIDVFATARSAGYDIQVLTDREQVQNRFGILLIE